MMNIQWKNHYFESIDPKEARRILDEELYGLERVKQRIMETIYSDQQNSYAASLRAFAGGACGNRKISDCICGCQDFEASLDYS